MADLTTILTSQTISSNTSSVVFDRKHGDRDPLISVSVGTVTGTNPTLTPTLMHSLDGSTWDTLATASAITATAGKVIFGPARTLSIGRFLRLDLVVGGTTPVFNTTEVKLQLN